MTKDHYKFRQNAVKTHKKNLPQIKRGGIRL